WSRCCPPVASIPTSTAAPAGATSMSPRACAGCPRAEPPPGCTPRTTEEPSSARLVPHPVGGLVEGAEQAVEELALDALPRHGLGHAEQPLVAFHGADRERQVAGPQSRMAEALDVEIRAAQPAAEEPVQLVARSVQPRGMQRAHAGEARIPVHEVVEVIHQRAHAGLAPEALERRAGLAGVALVMHP